MGLWRLERIVDKHKTGFAPSAFELGKIFAAEILPAIGSRKGMEDRPVAK